MVAAAKAGLHKNELDNLYPRLQEIPFTSETKRMTTLHKIEKGNVAYTKGAPEIILENCDSVLTSSGVKKLDDAARKQVLDTAQSFASQALRVLAIASKPDAVIESAQTGMTFLGLAGMIDPPRAEVAPPLRQHREAGGGPGEAEGRHAWIGLG